VDNIVTPAPEPVADGPDGGQIQPGLHFQVGHRETGRFKGIKIGGRGIAQEIHLNSPGGQLREEMGLRAFTNSSYK
jgi:hypothetical protein